MDPILLPPAEKELRDLLDMYESKEVVTMLNDIQNLVTTHPRYDSQKHSSLASLMYYLIRMFHFNRLLD